MPYPAPTVRLFQMVAHGKAAPRKGLSRGKAAQLLAEAGQAHKTGIPHRASSTLTRR